MLGLALCCLLDMGCVSRELSKCAYAALGSQTGSRSLEQSTVEARDGRVILAEDYPPLPPSVLLGASSLQERDDISTAVVRFLATLPCDFMPDIRYRFIGFYGEGINRHDPSRDLLERIRRNKLRIEPVSETRFGRFRGKTLSNSEQSAHAVVYFIVFIQKLNQIQAEVTVHEYPGVGGGSLEVILKLTQKRSKWAVTGIKPGGAVFGSIGEQLKKGPANNRTETNPAYALRLQSRASWRGVVYPKRSAASQSIDESPIQV